MLYSKGSRTVYIRKLLSILSGDCTRSIRSILTVVIHLNISELCAKNSSHHEAFWLYYELLRVSFRSLLQISSIELPSGIFWFRIYFSHTYLIRIYFFPYLLQAKLWCKGQPSRIYFRLRCVVDDIHPVYRSPSSTSLRWRDITAMAAQRVQFPLRMPTESYNDRIIWECCI
jgi:hypothetical protein